MKINTNVERNTTVSYEVLMDSALSMGMMATKHVEMDVRHAHSHLASPAASGEMNQCAARTRNRWQRTGERLEEGSPVKRGGDSGEEELPRSKKGCF